MIMKMMKKERILNLVKYHMHHLYIIKNLPFAKTKEISKGCRFK